MKKLVSMALCLMMVLSLASCGGKKTAESSQNTVAQATATADATKVAVGLSTDLTAIDPQMSNKVQDVVVYGNMFDTLVYLDDNLNVIPGLAESWERVDDTKTIFKLREGVKFSNGDPLTADDVVFTIERVLESPYVNYLLGFVDHAEKVDDLTVAVYSTEAFGPLLQHFSVPYAGIVNKKAAEEMGEEFSKKPIGTGPYKLAEWKPGDYVALTVNENYWGDKPSVTDVKYAIMPDTSARLMSLESGEIDLAYDIAPNDVAKIEENEKLKVVTEPSMASFFLPLNLSKEGPLQDVNVRQAINLAIDRQALCDAVCSGYALPSGLVIAPGCVGYSDKYQAPARDLEKAKEYMAKSAYPDGCNLSMYVFDDSERIEAANIIQYQLSEIGINLEIEIMESSAVWDRVERGEFDTMIDRWLTDTCDAYYTLTGMYASWSSAGEGNDAFYASEEVDKLILEAGQEFDDQARVADYEKVYDKFYEDMPYVMTYYPYTCIAMKNSINGFKINPNGAHQIKNLSVQ